MARIIRKINMIRACLFRVEVEYISPNFFSGIVEDNVEDIQKHNSRLVFE